jgi:hypothetical protein
VPGKWKLSFRHCSPEIAYPSVAKIHGISSMLLVALSPHSEMLAAVFRFQTMPLGFATILLLNNKTLRFSCFIRGAFNLPKEYIEM